MEQEALPVKSRDELLADIMSGLYAPILDALVGAYEAGKAEGDQRSREEMTLAVQKLMNHAFSEMLSGRISIEELIKNRAAAKPPAPELFDPPASPAGAKDNRVPRGSARPAVLANLRRAPNGISAKGLYRLMSHTGIKENTVRGTLNKLRAEGLTIKRGELWLSKAQTVGPPPVAPVTAHE